MSKQAANDYRGAIGVLVRAYSALILVVLGFVPSFAIAYLHFFQDPALRFEHHTFHEIAIAVALAQSGFITWVTWRCFLRSGEVFLRWLTIGFLAFTIIYAMHGILTRASQELMMHFIMFGPASRFVMAACFLIGIVKYEQPVVPAGQRIRPEFWLRWIGAFVSVTILVYLMAGTVWAGSLRVSLETSSLILLLASLVVIVVRRPRSPLILIFALSLLFFSQSSVAFLIGSVWNHQWWLAHAIFAAGFIGLSYGIIQAFLTTGAFSTVYSQADLMDNIRAEKARAEEALLELNHAHITLEKLAATDPLTGIANRREFMERAIVEIARSSRSESPLSLVMIDIDHFKELNDTHGHQTGDKALQEFVSLTSDALRLSDLLARHGGEEFVILLPDTTREQAGQSAERLRKIIETKQFTVDEVELNMTASFGVAQFGVDGATYDELINVADQRMYQAKRDGRNRVVAA
ncbi:MAG: GGDEF domain-containing protein [Xanthomonadales bacterium]|nr:GGDEF domain-containing protein [Xanthomonadales bacterium]